MYTDDTHIIAPSALPELLDICDNFSVSNCIVFNEKWPPWCMRFKPNSLTILFIPTLCLNDVPLTVSGSVRKLFWCNYT